MTQPCRCEQPNPACRRSGEPMVGRLWELCRGVHCTPAQSAAYRQLWDGQPPPSTPRVCRHRGEVVREEECPTCTGRVYLKVFACAEHLACTAHKPLPGLACCATCLAYQPEE